MVQNKLNDLLTPKALKQNSGYISAGISEDDINELADAYENKDYATMHKILSENTDENHIKMITQMDNYKPFTEELSAVVISQNRSKLKEDRVTRQKAGAYKPTIQNVLTPRKSASKEKIKQKQGEGKKEYERSKPVNFKESETKFLERAIDKGLKGDALVKRYNQIYPTRSASSILTKKSRIIKSRKNARKDN